MVNSGAHQPANDLAASTSHTSWLNISEFITQSTTTKDNTGSNTVAEDLAGSSSDIASHNISHDLFDPTQFLYYSHEAYAGDGLSGMVTNDSGLWVNQSTTSTEGDQIGQYGNIFYTSHDLEFISSAYNMTPDSAEDFLSPFNPILFGGPSPTQPDGVDRRLFLFDIESATLPPSSSNGSTPLCGDHTSPVFFSSSLFPDINALGHTSTFLSGEDREVEREEPEVEREEPEVEREEPFLSKRPIRLPEYCRATIPPPVKEIEDNTLEGEAGEEAEDKSSTGFVGPPERSPPPNMDDLNSEIKGDEAGPSNSSHQPEASASAPTSDILCPGVSGKSKADIISALNKLLAQAESDGAEARKVGLSAITQDGNTSTCTECGKTNRRDRLMDHVLFKHFDLRTWSCPLCRKAYTTRDALSQHLKATRVKCLCQKYITKNNWYAHAKQCKVCLAVSGDLRIEKGQIAVEQRTAAQAGPSVQGSSPIENERGPQGRTQGCTPRAQRKRPAVSRNASVKRKAPGDDDESGDEVGEERVFKRAKRRHT